VALDTQHAKSTRRFVSSVACPAVQYFSHYGTIFGKKVIEHQMCFFVSSDFYPKNFSFYEEFSDILS
jgi:hypothetical protein